MMKAPQTIGSVWRNKLGKDAGDFLRVAVYICTKDVPREERYHPTSVDAH